MFPVLNFALHVILRIFPEEQLRVQEVLVLQAVVYRLASDVVVHLVLHDNQGRGLSEVADDRDLFGPDVENLEEQLVASGRIRLGADLVPDFPDIPEEVAVRGRFTVGVVLVDLPAAEGAGPGAVELGADPG